MKDTPRITQKKAPVAPYDWDWSGLTENEIVARLDETLEKAEKESLKWYTLDELRQEFSAKSAQKIRERKVCAIEY